MSDPPSAYVAHSVAGRTRIRIPGRRGDSGYFNDACERLGRFSGVLAVAANPLTGSILLRHANGLDALGSFARDSRLFTLQNADPPALPSASAPISSLPERAMRALPVRPSFDNLSDPRVFGFALLWTLGFVQLLRGQIVPPAVSLFWYGINALFLAVPQRSRDMNSGT